VNPTTIVVRPAIERDATSVSALLHELGYWLEAAQVEKNIALLSLSSSDAVLVAEVDSGVVDVVGVLSFHIIPLFHVVGNLGRITSLVVSPGWRQHGVGRKLAEAAQEFAWSQGCLRIEVTSGDRRAEALEFYQKLGYQIDERRFIKHLTPG